VETVQNAAPVPLGILDSNLAVAETLVFELDREGRLVDADRWFLALDFLRLAGMLDAAPADQNLGRVPCSRRRVAG
jgi:hypothetical protein